MNGIDVHHAIASYLYQDLENRQEPSELLRGKVERGELGAKSGQGFYAWSPERRERVLREKSEALAELAAWLERGWRLTAAARHRIPNIRRRAPTTAATGPRARPHKRPLFRRQARAPGDGNGTEPRPTRSLLEAT